MNAVDAFIARVTRRPPDFCIGGNDNPYMRRWWVIPRNRWQNIYLHNTVRSDDDRALHDHPWLNMSVVLRGGYYEVMPKYPDVWPHNRELTLRWRGPGSVIFRRARAPHRLVVPPGKQCWTLFLTGPRIREWGFYCPQGWRHYMDFVDSRDAGAIGRGCE